MHRRRVCVVTGSRAEYGHLKWLIQELRECSNVEFQMVATGAHLSLLRGNTINEILADGVPVNEKVEIALASDTAIAVAKSLGLGIMGFAEAFGRLSPDIIVILGDRFEMLAAAQAAMLQNIPIAHVHGGETTEGAIDEAIRHSITKMAHLHFVAAEKYRDTVIQLGEDPARVFNYGAPGLDHVRRTQFMSKQQLEALLGVVLKPPVLLMTYHPVTLNRNVTDHEVKSVISALNQLNFATVIITGVNSDPESEAVDRVIKEFVSNNPGKAYFFDSLGGGVYLSVLRMSNLVLGNSSSGIIEAPAFGVPSINIGNRQKGRLRASSVVDCEAESEQILAAINKALSPIGQKFARSAVSMYGSGDASKKIAEEIISYPLDKILNKSFYRTTLRQG